MASTENQQQHPNPAPPSLSAGGHEMHDYYAAQPAPRPPPQQEPYLTPYLGLRARLSQTWINRWTILLLLVLIRLLFAIASLDNNLVMARKQALSACTSVENVGSAMASMPHYMSGGVNSLSADGIEKAIEALMKMLILNITAVQEIVLFMINMLTQTYVCLITLAVGGSLRVAINVAEDMSDFLNSTLKDVGDNLGSAAERFDDGMDRFLNRMNRVGDFLTGGESDPPTIDLSDEIQTLENLQLPPGYDQGLRELNNSIPNFAQVRNFTNAAIRFPFEEVKKLINESLPSYKMDRSLFPVPAKEKLTFCSDSNGISDFFQKLFEIAAMARRIFLIVLLIAAVLVMAPMAYRDIRRYRLEKERARIIATNAHHPMDAVYVVSRPYTSTFGLWVAGKFKSPRRQTAARWTVAYATTVPALLVLSLAIAGLLACLCQYILLKAIEKEVPALTDQVGEFADKVMFQLNNASEQWAAGTNDMIGSTSDKINQDVLGWVNITTNAVNDTLNVFVDGMMDVLDTTFGGTVLHTPILDVLNCLVLLKIEGIQTGLTWVGNNARIDFPLMPVDTFSLGGAEKVAATQDEMLAPEGAGARAADEISDAVLWVTSYFAKAIRQEAIICSCILLIWVVIVLIGLIRAGSIFYRGGSGGVYRSPRPIQPGNPAQEKHELDTFFATRNAESRPSQEATPTYEQATSSRQDGDHTANRLNGQAYTLTPNPLPTFNFNPASPTTTSGFSPSQEKFGSVSGQYVDNAVRRPTHVRASSHGDFAVTSPTSPPQGSKTPNISTNPPSTNPHGPSNPFADPSR
ncbi:hypothetical protein MBLNU230_g8394t1 [Neophaeotheca triangularis]